MGMTAGGALAVVEHKRGSFHVETYEGRLAAVLAIINNGAIGEPPSGTVTGYGSAEHLAALRTVVAKAQEIIALIENPPPPSCNKHDDCNAADARAKAAGREAVHCSAEDCEECFGS